MGGGSPVLLAFDSSNTPCPIANRNEYEMKRVDFRDLDQTLRDRRRKEAYRPLVGTL
jgi:hypothetical protein